MIALFVILTFVYSLVSRLLERTIVTAPIVFATAGLLIHFAVPAVWEHDASRKLLLEIAEIGLVLLLFTDASRTDLKELAHDRGIPARLLSVGLLLSLVLGLVVALAIFPQMTIWEAGILAAILAPTDAGLGQVIVSSPRIPRRIREALNVEAGLNDGLAVPFLMLFIDLANSGAGFVRGSLMQLIVEQLVYGTLIGVALGLVGGWLLNLARRNEWIVESLQGVGLVAIPLMCAFVSHVVGASMFIAAFVAGLAVQAVFREAGEQASKFGEEWGKILNALVFFLFGFMFMETTGMGAFAPILYAVLSLTLLRMLPVALALIGTRSSPATVLFMGWFGPRGLASIVLGLVFLEHEVHSPGGSAIRATVAVTVLMSIYAHGLTALPGIDLYARTLGPPLDVKSRDASPELRD